jgi:hypothetical protein
MIETFRAGLADQPLTHLARGEQLALRPASGPSLMQIFIVIVGGSISTKASGWRSSVSVSVSPM